ncbi:MAG: HPr family phosphocarrier protein, partial [Methylobacteriaceae bacterium]|nr:HPr family phosphocarrier protein [Methylobacteriaceae bacterium]
MAVKATKGATLHFRARGPDAAEALAALRELVALGFSEEGVTETRARGSEDG